LNLQQGIEKHFGLEELRHHNCNVDFAVEEVKMGHNLRSSMEAAHCNPHKVDPHMRVVVAETLMPQAMTRNLGEL
jgi:hypothetical protein